MKNDLKLGTYDLEELEITKKYPIFPFLNRYSLKTRLKNRKYLRSAFPKKYKESIRNKIIHSVVIAVLGYISIRLIELMTVGHLNFDYDKYYISKDEILKRYPELKFVRKDSVSEYYNIEGKKGFIGFINPISHKFCSDCNRIRLTADGHLKPCLHNNNEIFIKEIQGEPLLNKLREAIHAKPISHTLDESKDNRSDRPMNKIGG